MMPFNADSPIPIRDTNNNQILEGSEVIDQLTNQQTQLQVSAILKEAGITDIAKSYAKLSQTRPLTVDDFSHFADQLKTVIHEYATTLAHDKKAHTDRVKQTKQNSTLSEEEKKKEIAQINYAFDFAQSYKTTFPNGVTIAPEDVPLLLKSFLPNNLTIRPPIVDTNKNGAMDGQELAAQLNGEEENYEQHTPAEKVHAVLNYTDIANSVETYNLSAHDESKKIVLAQCTNKFKKELGELVSTYKDLLKADPHLLAEREHEILKNPKARSVDEVNLELADMRNLINFVQTYDKTYPNGINVTPEDMMGIMGHFRPLISATRKR